MLSNAGNVEEGENVFLGAIILFDRNVREGLINKNSSLKAQFINLSRQYWRNYKANLERRIDNPSEELIAENIRNQFKAIQSEHEYKPEEPPFITRYAWLLWTILVVVLLIGSYLIINRNDSFNSPNPLIPFQDTLKANKDSLQTAKLNKLKQSGPKLDKGLSPISPQRKAKLVAIAKEFYKSPEMDALRSDNTGIEGPITKAQKAWTEHDLKKVITILETVDEKDPRYLNAQLLLGHAYYQTRNYQKAKYSFNIVKQRNIMPYSEEAEWNILITLVAQHKVRTPYFKKHLDKIIKDAGHSYNAQAIALEEKLK